MGMKIPPPNAPHHTGHYILDSCQRKSHKRYSPVSYINPRSNAALKSYAMHQQMPTDFLPT